MQDTIPDQSSDRSATPERENLKFDSDRGAGRSKWIAGGVVLLLVLWMGSGFVLPAPEEEQTDRAEGPQPVAVAVRESRAEQVAQYFTGQGYAEPDRDTTILAEAGGEVAELLVEVGADMRAGDEIGRVVSVEREAELASAQEELRRAEREDRNARELLDRGVGTEDRVSQASAALSTAQAALTSAELALEDTIIRAPFDGRLELLSINRGEYIQAGAEIGRLVDNAPLTVVVDIPQQARGTIRPGQTADVTFITGEEAQGRIAFVGSAASQETRTFRAEISVPNADRAIPAGVSASVRIPIGEVEAHFLSPAILSLDTDGTLGLKTVTDDNLVEFHPVQIARAATDGVWLTGLPSEARVITVGQGFVSDGEEVAPQPESEAPAAPRIADDDPSLPDPGEEQAAADEPSGGGGQAAAAQAPDAGSAP